MGGSNSKRDESFDPNEWQEVEDPNNDEDGQYTVVRNRRTGQLLDKYQLQFPNQKQYNRYLDSVDYRRDEENIVRVVHYQPKVVKQFCGSAYMLNVYLEHCRSRFCEFKDIPSPDNLYCAVAMLDGYQKLYRKVGRFYVSQNEAMIDENGKIRVWLNSDFSQNQAQDLRPINNNNVVNKSEQYTMVNDIMNIIFQNSDDTDEPQHFKFRDYYQRQKVNYDQRVGFGQARNIIYNYAKTNGIEIPDVFTSVLNIYDNGQDDLDHLDDDHPVGGRRMLDNEDLFHGNETQGRYHQVSSVVNPAQGNIQNINNNTYSSGQVFSSRQAQPTFAQPIYQLASINSNSNRNIIANQLPPSAIRPPNLSPSPMPKPYPHPQFHSVPHNAPQPRVLTGAQPINQRFNYQNTVMSSQSQPGRAPGFSFTIKPQPNTNAINRAVPINIPQQPRPIPQQGSVQPIGLAPTFTPPIIALNPNSNLPQVQLNNPAPVLNAGIKKADSLPQQFSQQNKAIVRQHNKMQLGEQELEIQKKFILRSHGNNEEYINQANVIRDLSELHKIQEEERSKRSNIQVDNSRNVSQNRQDQSQQQHGQQSNQYKLNHHDQHEQQDQHQQQQHDQEHFYQNHPYNNDDKLSDDILKEAEKDLDEVKKNKSNNNKYQGGYDGFYQEQNLFREALPESLVDGKQFVYQPSANINTGNNNFRSQPIQVGQKVVFNNASNSTALYQQNSNNYYGAQTNANMINVNTNSNAQPATGRPPLPPQLQSYQTYNSTNTYNHSVGLSQSQMQSMAQGQTTPLGESRSKRQFYFTIANQIQLDPQIANDLALYVKT